MQMVDRSRMPPTIGALLADITTVRVDAVVNAANRSLMGGGGVDGAIHRAAGAADLSVACAALGYRRCVEVADGLAVASMAFPAISTGAYGFPEARAAFIAVETLRSIETSVQQILLVAFDRRVLQSFEAALAS